jgi:hypothetical protein
MQLEGKLSPQLPADYDVRGETSPPPRSTPSCPRSDRQDCGWAEIFPIVDRRVTSEVCPMFFQLGTGSSLARACEPAAIAIASRASSSWFAARTRLNSLDPL